MGMVGTNTQTLISTLKFAASSTAVRISMQIVIVKSLIYVV